MWQAHAHAAREAAAAPAAVAAAVFCTCNHRLCDFKRATIPAAEWRETEDQSLPKHVQISMQRGNEKAVEAAAAATKESDDASANLELSIAAPEKF